ncbi:MAG: hypothetical protein J6S09_04380 [Paludibacteraceae bacterium]|nr:hypothetical protein [Paludibacteraceae bacterium]
MKRVYNLIVLCMLLICQQNIVAQSYNLGKQKQSFAYETLYANQHGMSQVVKSNNEMVNTQPAQNKVTNKNEQKVLTTHKKIIQLINNLTGNSTFKSIVVDVYIKIYQSSKKTQDEFLQLQQIQHVVLTYLEDKENIYTNLVNQLQNASSMQEEIQIFLSYYQE